MISLAQKALNFAKAATTHIASGVHLCSQEQINARYAICQPCEFLKDLTCQKCGCPISQERGWLSKLSWATSECPIGKWLAIPTSGG